MKPGVIQKLLVCENQGVTFFRNCEIQLSLDATSYRRRQESPATHTVRKLQNSQP